MNRRRVARVHAGALATVAFGFLDLTAAAQPRAQSLDDLGNPGNRQLDLQGLDRGADRAEAKFWENRHQAPPAAPLPPATQFPGLASPLWFQAPRHGTKTGPMSLADLHLSGDGKGGYRGERPGYKFSIDRDGGIHFADKPSFDARPAFGLGILGLLGTFDLTDLLMRLHGDDPYVYDKARVVGLTRDLRSRMTDVDRKKRLDGAIAALPTELASVWARSDLSPEARRGLLFSLWDELVEAPPAGTTAPNAALETEAATLARAAILGFIRRELPEGSTRGFGAAELERLNAHRRSRAPFAPYAPPAPGR